MWATQPIAAIEAVKAATVRAEIQDATQSATILNLLNQQASQSTITTDETQERTHVKGGDIVAQMVRLKHR